MRRAPRVRRMFSSTARYSRPAQPALGVLRVVDDGLGPGPTGPGRSGHRGGRWSHGVGRSPQRQPVHPAARPSPRIFEITPTEGTGRSNVGNEDELPPTDPPPRRQSWPSSVSRAMVNTCPGARPLRSEVGNGNVWLARSCLSGPSPARSRPLRGPAGNRCTSNNTVEGTGIPDRTAVSRACHQPGVHLAATALVGARPGDPCRRRSARQAPGQSEGRGAASGAMWAATKSFPSTMTG